MKFASRIGIATAILAAGAVGGGLAMSAAASAATTGTTGASMAQATNYSFRTLDNGADPTFNQLLGINDHGVIAGYFGSGAQGHPNKGYLLSDGAYTPENFPQSVQTQVTGLNNRGVTVGFWSGMNTASQVNDNFGFWETGGQFHTVNFPSHDNANPPVNQLLGVNDDNTAVGFYTDANGSNHGYEYRIGSGRFTPVTVPGATSVTAAAINDRGDVAGFSTNAAGTTLGFLLTRDGQLISLNVPGATATSALGLNSRDEVAGFYTTGSGNSTASHGFTWTPRGGFVTADDPNGVGTTTINGLNDHGDLVGFYNDADGNTHGFLARPGRAHAQFFTVHLASMPQGTATLSRDQHGNLTAEVSAIGFTPGSTHNVALAGRDGAVLATFSPVTALGSGQIAGVGGLARSSFTGHVPDGSRLVITLDATAGSPVIATTAPVSTGQASYRLHAIDGNGTPRGFATVAYDPAARTITVTMTGSGFTPGAHAAHIHIGSCQNQGGVQYMLMDFTADANGQISHEVRTVTGVNSPIPAGAWYLNVHQGDASQILANGQPTSLFRPLTCGQIGG